MSRIDTEQARKQSKARVETRKVLNCFGILHRMCSEVSASVLPKRFHGYAEWDSHKFYFELNTFKPHYVNHVNYIIQQCNTCMKASQHLNKVDRLLTADTGASGKHLEKVYAHMRVAHMRSIKDQLLAAGDVFARELEASWLHGARQPDSLDAYDFCNRLTLSESPLELALPPPSNEAGASAEPPPGQRSDPAPASEAGATAEPPPSAASTEAATRDEVRNHLAQEELHS